MEGEEMQGGGGRGEQARGVCFVCFHGDNHRTPPSWSSRPERGPAPGSSLQPYLLRPPIRFTPAASGLDRLRRGEERPPCHELRARNPRIRARMHIPAAPTTSVRAPADSWNKRHTRPPPPASKAPRTHAHSRHEPASREGARQHTPGSLRGRRGAPGRNRGPGQPDWGAAPPCRR
ncbi:hypothetical protein T484DRAFT_1970228 [Baffinella frigidus]|nr:hypothetical protein T484DRAFT_1970228 [Cryptophyta sp. CCMP2293]